MTTVLRRYSQQCSPSAQKGVYRLDEAANSFALSPEALKEWEANGFLVVRGLLTKRELVSIKLALEKDQAIMQHAFEVNDGAGRKSKLCLWNHPGKDITGMIARSEKVAGTMSTLLGGEVYHYHTKLMMKEPYTGGRFVWHQDYGYWYKNGYHYGDMMATAFIAVDPCVRANGCMEVFPRSHKMGRIDHVMVGGQTGADPERISDIAALLPVEHVELDPGDCLFFHSNLLHKSNQNDSPMRRWAFLCCYNRKENTSSLPHHHPGYVKLDIVSNDMIANCPEATNVEGKDFMDPRKDHTIKLEKIG